MKDTLSHATYKCYIFIEIKTVFPKLFSAKEFVSMHFHHKLTLTFNTLIKNYD
jgi:hypothetical protein